MAQKDAHHDCLGRMISRQCFLQTIYVYACVVEGGWKGVATFGDSRRATYFAIFPNSFDTALQENPFLQKTLCEGNDPQLPRLAPFVHGKMPKNSNYLNSAHIDLGSYFP